MNAPLPFSKRFVIEDIVSKNLFNKERVTENWYLSYSDGKTPIWDSNMVYTTDYIDVETNTDYTMSYLDEATILVIYEYDENKNFIKYNLQNNENKTLTITTTSITKFVRMSCGKLRTNKMQLEKGSLATEYCKHFEFEHKEKLKIIDFGTLGNVENKAVDMGIEISNITRISGMAKNGNTILPFPNNEVKIFIEGTWLNITTTTDMSNYSAILRIYYED